MPDFKIGDHVVADKAIYDTFTETFVIFAISYSMLGTRIFKVRAIGEPNSYGTCFYASEISLVR